MLSRLFPRAVLMPNPKLTPEQAREIYERAHRGEPYKKIASDYGIGVHVVSDIKRGISYFFYTGERKVDSLETLAEGHEVRPIPGCNGFWIRDDGRVIYEIAGTLRASRYNGYSANGYKTIYVDYKKLQLHRVLALAFKPEGYFDGAVVRHLDDDRLNNNLDNLEFGTYKDNYEDSIRNGRRTKKPKHSRLGKISIRPSKNIQMEIHNLSMLIQMWEYAAIHHRQEVENVDEIIYHLKSKRDKLHKVVDVLHNS